MALVTFETVADAAERLQAAGGRASVRNVIEALGGGSPNGVLRHLRAWQDGRPLVRASGGIEIEDGVLQAIRGQIERATVAASSAAEARAASIEDDLQAMADANQAAEQRIETLQADLERAQAEATLAGEQLADARRTADSDRTHAERIVADLRAELAAERTARGQAEALLAQSEVRLEAIPTLQAEVAELKAGLALQQAARESAEQKAAVLTDRLENLGAQLEALRTDRTRIEGELREDRARIEGERDKALQMFYQVQGEAQGEAREQARRIHEQEIALETFRGDLAQAQAEARERDRLIHEQEAALEAFRVKLAQAQGEAQRSPWMEMDPAQDPDPTADPVPAPTTKPATPRKKPATPTTKPPTRTR
jgi:chromosome segregation ATPase